MKLKISNPLTKLCAGMSAYLMAANAHAQATGETLGTLSTSIAGNFWQTGEVLSTASYIVGAAFGMTGVLKLKAHAENPAQVNMMPGLSRLGAGIGLIALPWLIGTVFNTAGVTDQTATTGVVGGSTDRFNQ